MRPYFDSVDYWIFLDYLTKWDVQSRSRRVLGSRRTVVLPVYPAGQTPLWPPPWSDCLAPWSPHWHWVVAGWTVETWQSGSGVTEDCTLYTGERLETGDSTPERDQTGGQTTLTLRGHTYFHGNSWYSLHHLQPLLVRYIKRPTPLTQKGFPIVQNSLTKSSQRQVHSLCVDSRPSDRLRLIFR